LLRHASRAGAARTCSIQHVRYRWIGCALVVPPVVVAAGSYLAAWRLSRAMPAHVGEAPADLGARDISFTSDSGATIRGWLAPAREGGAAVLLLPAVRANRTAMISRARLLRAAGYSTLLIDFQATGESTGRVITFGWRERLDVRAAVRFLRRESPGRPVGIIGTSLGGAAALLAAPPLDVQAIVLEAVYPDFAQAVVNRLAMRVGPAAQLVSVPLLSLAHRRLGATAAELRPIDHINTLTCPVLVMAGAEDRHTTLQETQALFAAARAPKDLWIVPGVAHADLLDATGDDYRDHVLQFLAANLRMPIKTAADPGP
jgi:alpha-beta hydrolase superfamily lysophospholipase